MLVGHFAAGFVAKRLEPKISLGTLVLAAVAVDLLWTVFLIIGVEHVEFKPGRGAENYFAAGYIDISHSLVTGVLWAALFAAGYYILRHHHRGALVLFALVLSHCLLDFIAHRPFMPLAPGLSTYVGLGLWTSVPLTLIIEGGLWLVAAVLFARMTKPRNRIGVFAYWIVVPILLLVLYNNITGPPPPSQIIGGVSSLIFFSLVVAWAYWMNRLRPAATLS